MKRDDLSGLGGGGNKARKLEFLCGAALAERRRRARHRRGGPVEPLPDDGGRRRQARSRGAPRAVGRRTGPRRGDRESVAVGVVRRAAPLHRRPRPPLGRARDRPRVGHRRARRGRPAAVLDPDRRQHRHRCAGLRVRASFELLDQLDAAGLAPSTIVFTSSSGGTHAGLLAGRAAALAAGRTCPDILAIGVAKGVNLGYPDIAALADETLALMELDATVDGERRRDRHPVDRRRLRRADRGRRRGDPLGGVATAAG